MRKILILSDSNFEDDQSAFFRQNLFDKLVEHGCSVKVLLRQPFYFFKILFAIRDADVIFIPNFPSISRTVLVLTKFFKKKLIIKIISDYVWERAITEGRTFLLFNDFQQSAKSGALANMHKSQIELCQYAETVVVPSEFLARTLQNWQIEKNKIRLIHDGICIKPLIIAKEEARKKIAVAGNLLVSSGPLVNWRGFRMLIKIMPQLLQINQFFRLVIIGNGPELKVLRTMIKNLNLENRVYLIIPKNKDELAWYLAASDIFISNSSHEGFPRQALEAMSAGVPIVITAAGANREIIKQGENGFMVKHNDEFNLIEAVKTVWQTPELQKKFIENGKNTAANFSFETMVSETVKILNS